LFLTGDSYVPAARSSTALSTNSSLSAGGTRKIYYSASRAQRVTFKERFQSDQNATNTAKNEIRASLSTYSKGFPRQPPVRHGCSCTNMFIILRRFPAIFLLLQYARLWFKGPKSGTRITTSAQSWWEATGRDHTVVNQPGSMYVQHCNPTTNHNSLGIWYVTRE
jgi:hypothetical protein